MGWAPKLLKMRIDLLNISFELENIIFRFSSRGLAFFLNFKLGHYLFVIVNEIFPITFLCKHYLFVMVNEVFPITFWYKHYLFVMVDEVFPITFLLKHYFLCLLYDSKV